MAINHSTSNNGLTNAVFYLRMSSDKQETSIEQQRSELVKLADRQGYRVLREYLDEGISGDATERRQGFLQMREDAQRGEFTVMLCWDMDRFGRFDLIDAGHWIKPFKDHGVRLETIAQGKIDWNDLVGQAMYSVAQIGKAQYLRDLSRNCLRGRLAQAIRGEGTGGTPPFGYRQRRGKLVIDEPEASIVRWLFGKYNRSKGSLKSVALALNRDGVLGAKGGRWSARSVLNVLRNVKYTGCSSTAARP